jgi:tetratricopeptide (TPR) repeat protein
MLRSTILILTCFLFVPGFRAQTKLAESEKLALQYFDAREFEKANVYFSELYEHNPSVWYLYYYKSLVAVKDYDKAEKITRKQLRINKNNVQFYVYLGHLYGLQAESKKEKEYYDRAVKEMLPMPPYIYNLANAFTEEKKYDYAIMVYNKARKESPDYPYFYERAEVYKLKNDLVAMINEYLDAIEFRETELETVQMRLQNSLGYDDETGGMNNPLLKQELQKRIQKSPDLVVFSEFLIFILKQQKEFNGAFVQSRALDKRLKEDGRRLFELGKICVANQDWECAKRCFEYVVEKGPQYVFYDAAIVEGLNAEYLYLTSLAQPESPALKALETKLKSALQKYSETKMQLNLLRNLAKLEAFYLNDTESAIALLEHFLSTSPAEASVKAEFKLLLGDIYLLHGEIWEASLLYSQVEKDFKYDAIAQDAKFKNAKLSYYAGDFPWAKTQADVLKGATSKLIANDALDLSLIITDAIGVDTNDVPLRLFASADLLVVQHRYNEALARLDSINLLYASHTLGDDIYYKKAQVYESLNNFENAETMYRNILEYFPDELYGDDAQFKLAVLYDKYMTNPEKASAAYEEVMTKYPGSIYTVEARKRFRQLRGDFKNN